MAQKRMQTVTRAEFADLIGRTPQAVSQYIGAGMPARHAGTRGKRIQIDIEAAVQWVLNRLYSDMPERERLAKERADQQALANDETRAGLVMRHHVEQGVEHLLSEFDACAQLPDGLADEIAKTDDPAAIRSRLMDWTRSVRAEYADRVPA
jgi:hypothetical protein